MTPAQMQKLNDFGEKSADKFEGFLYGSRWILAPMYAGLVLSLLIYCVKFLIELWDLCLHGVHQTEAEVMLVVLGLVDITMIANLILMIMIGGYTIFVRALKFHKLEDRPQWLNHINSGTLKVKMGMSLLGVTAIHLLKDFVDAEKVSWETMWKRLLIHGIFIVSSIVLAFVDKMLHPPGHESSDKILAKEAAQTHAQTPTH